jgi:TldD protein
MPESKLSRRRFVQAGLGAGAGLALWELYRLGFNNRIDRGAASLRALQEIGLDRDSLRRLLDVALAGGGEYADIFLENSLGSYVGFDGENFQNSGLEAVSGAAIRVRDGGHTSFRATHDLSWESLRRAAREAGAAARGGATAPRKALEQLTPSDLYPVAAPALFEPLGEKQRFLARAVEAARGAYEHVRVARAYYRDSMRFLTVANSEGVVAHDSQPSLKIVITVAAVNADTGKTGLGQFSGGGHYGLEYFEQHAPERLGQRAAEIARSQLEAVPAPSGQLPVVLGPAYSGVLMHEAVGHGLEADFNVKGYSAYSGRIGQMVASPLCTLYDDGHRPGLNGSINFDDEGVASSRTLLIERGRLVGYMHNRETAAQMNVAPTGNGRRQAYNYPPLPRMTNTYLEGGETPHDEIIRSVKRGIYARSFAGGSVNITTGDFTFVPMEAYLIEGGRVTSPLANVMLLGNGPDILNRVSMVGHDMLISDNLWECGKQGQMIPVTVGMPTIKVESMTVGGNAAG